MNFSCLNGLPHSSHDDSTDDWFGGEARASIPALGVDCISARNDKQGDDRGNDWIPL
jgi:hypothetical protein